MYKVMLVDDDYPVLELLSEMIDWDGIGLTLQSMHENGAEALKEAETNMPDILITDIGMPKLNGIELTKNLKAKKPDLTVAILSCHNEFGYAQQALKLQVQEYILKDMLDIDEINQMLLQFKEAIDKERSAKKNQRKMTTTIERSKLIMIERFIHKTVDHPIYNENEWYNDAAVLGLQAGCEYKIILCIIDQYQASMGRYRTRDMLDFVVHNVITEVLKDEKHVSYGHFQSNESFLFLPKQKDNQATIKLIRKIQSALSQTLGISMSFMIGNTGENPLQIKTEMTRLLNATTEKFYLKPQSVEEFKQLTVSKQNIFKWYDEASKELKEVILTRSMDEKNTVFEKWIHFITTNQFPAEAVKDWMLKILLDIKVRIQALAYFKQYESAETLHDTFSKINSVYELEDWLKEYFIDVIEFANTEPITNMEIANACKYISDHINQKITLDEVAQHLHLNSSYFSRLFKKEVGETFVKYVVNLKMKRAKELLEQTNYTVYEISEQLGYDNQSYFNKIFKASEGVTPIEYKNGVSS
ncbi:AraC family transcriptional regulator [Bacillus sp. FJAT-50079]|uniref:response regulator transcription factor n=1 Tax=Bacillus sp. FJAT-50079 TaxID=2833577 RepID=UPI001BC9B366|nr:AraC family transcriptional regulator [Bacillus sp. FJAT-50079]MBS4210171.1 AraC family transcriptional regulator [Bacillus sp. FJAT-50079]